MNYKIIDIEGLATFTLPNCKPRVSKLLNNCWTPAVALRDAR